MEKTEMMKRYEAETGDNSQIVWHGGSFASDDYIAWLEDQLTWRPVSEKPEHGKTVLATYLNRCNELHTGSFCPEFLDAVCNCIVEFCQRLL